MEVKKYDGGVLDANCYVVLFKKKAIIIDPCIKLDVIKKLVGDYEVSFVVITHGHADHICSLKEVVDYYNVPIFLAKHAVEKLENPEYNLSGLIGNPFSFSFDKDKYHYVNDYEKVNLDGEEIVFIHTPGHSDCSICIRIGNNFFSGDTIFALGAGRTDLYSGNEAILAKSINKIIDYFNRNDTNFIIYPGHEYEIESKNLLKDNPYLGRYILQNK